MKKTIGAVKPSFFQSVIKIGEIPPEDSTELTDEIIALNSLGLSNGWKVLLEYIAEIEEGLDNSILVAEEAGASFEEIGQKTIVKDLCKYVTKRIKTRVFDAVESAERHAGESK